MKKFSLFRLSILLWQQAPANAKVIYVVGTLLRILLLPFEFLNLILLKSLIEKALLPSGIQESLFADALYLVLVSFLLMLLRLASLRLNRKSTALISNTININYIKSMWRDSLHDASINLADVSQKCVITTHKIDKGFINPINQIQINLLSSAGILIAIFNTVPFVSFAALIPVVLASTVFLRTVNKTLKASSKMLSSSYTSLVEFCQFLFNANVQIYSSSSFDRLLRIFNLKDLALRETEEQISFLNEVPKPIIEFFGIICILSLFGINLYFMGDTADAFAGAATFAIALQRLLPQITSTTGFISKIQGSHEFLNQYYLFTVSNRVNIEPHEKKSISSSRFSVSLYKRGISSSGKPISQALSLESLFKTITIYSDKLLFSENGLLSNDLTLRDGDKILIQGDSGVGKSTLFEDLAFYLNSLTPSINPPKPLAYFCPSRANLVNDTLENNVTLFSEISSSNIVSFDRALLGSGLSHCFNLDSPRHHRSNKPVSILNPETLSLGELQRLSVAQCLFFDAIVKIYDEPVANLNPDASRDLIANILSSAKNILIVISHSFGNAESVLFNRVIEIKSRPKEVLDNPIPPTRLF